jgi:hypothetical protein
LHHPLQRLARSAHIELRDFVEKIVSLSNNDHILKLLKLQPTSYKQNLANASKTGTALNRFLAEYFGMDGLLVRVAKKRPESSSVAFNFLTYEKCILATLFAPAQSMESQSRPNQARQKSMLRPRLLLRVLPSFRSQPATLNMISLIPAISSSGDMTAISTSKHNALGTDKRPGLDERTQRCVAALTTLKVPATGREFVWNGPGCQGSKEAAKRGNR